MSPPTGDESTRRIVMTRIENLHPHEEIIPKRLEELIGTLREDGMIHLPILVDDTTGVILDGHHRYHALKTMEARAVPTLRINYPEDPGINLAPGPNCPVDSLTRSLVLKTGQSDSTFPPKSTRHRVTFVYPEVNKSLDELREDPS